MSPDIKLPYRYSNKCQECKKAKVGAYKKLQNLGFYQKQLEFPFFP